MRLPTPSWAQQSPSGRAVRAVRAIQAPAQLAEPLPTHDEGDDTDPYISDEPNGDEMAFDMNYPPPLGPSTNAGAREDASQAAAMPTPAASVAQAEQAEQDASMRILQLESQVAHDHTSQGCVSTTAQGRHANQPCLDCPSPLPSPAGDGEPRAGAGSAGARRPRRTVTSGSP